MMLKPRSLQYLSLYKLIYLYFLFAFLLLALPSSRYQTGILSRRPWLNNRSVEGIVASIAHMGVASHCIQVRYGFDQFYGNNPAFIEGVKHELSYVCI